MYISVCITCITLNIIPFPATRSTARPLPYLGLQILFAAIFIRFVKIHIFYQKKISESKNFKKFKKDICRKILVLFQRIKYTWENISLAVRQGIPDKGTRFMLRL